ncbi:HMP-PP hydrolase (pyridoxal phosphatase) Cof [Serinicoccus hydrothermalis]|uniref:HMP-PP hydrolase (Pyridoxal phosphatase) Cof n=1 Tax=Serinicoccus hydrothermalis TaxID=1758689 RepID=A0A1B1N7Y2_9MICO|nr:HAD-IIB family hydrolase [Serinicoccus hydrothermalis]ANS77524.1 HMP-PP hydrolase (pyridoxal phosphatase) Cof [Serinicoccus hydrothermalis]
MSDPAAPAAVRVVATDCDGTLLRRDGTVSDYTRDVLDRCAAAGITVVLVTARPPRWMHELGDLGVSAVALCGNGAFTYDVARREIVGHRLMPAPLVTELLLALKDGLPGAHLATESLRGFAREPGFERASGREDGQWLVGDLTEIGAEPAGKILVRHQDWQTEQIDARVAAVVGDRAEVSHSGAVQMAEVTARGVTKAVALSTWCAEQTSPVAAHEVWAFGDMPNDIPMLEWAGRAHAVTNAHPDVVAVADEVVGSNEDDGVARTLERRLLVGG